MNDTPAPLTADQVDDLLSAELDGELAAAAHDLGLDLAEAQVRLKATPGVAERRAQLAAASAAVADVPELDDVTEARLRAAAVAAARDEARDLRTRRRRAWMSAGAAAAVVVAVLGIAAVGNHNSQSSGENKAAGRISQAPVVLSPTTGTSAAFSALGDVPNGAALQARVRAALGFTTSKKQLATAEHGNDVVPLPATATTLITNAGSSDYFSYNKPADATQAGPIQSCDATARLAAGAKAPPVLYATATLNHQPVTIYVYAHGTEYAIIASDQGCKVVLHRTVDR
jgi:hypothetical protein